MTLFFDIVLKLLAFLLAIFVLVLIHEFAHCFVARKLGVRVKRFSIGFGKPFYKWHGKDKTEYVIAPILLGGYVKMLESTEERHPREQDIKYMFDKKPLLIRVCIVLAGPFSNFIFAVLAFWVVLVLGMQAAKPVIGAVTEYSLAAHAGLKAGDEIFAVDKQNINSWSDMALAVIPYLGNANSAVISVRRGEQIIRYPLAINEWSSDDYKSELFADIGIIPYHPIVPPIIGKIAKYSPASKANLQVGDKIVMMGKQKINNWDEVLDYLKTHPSQNCAIKLKRGSAILQITVVTSWRINAQFKKIGYLGVGPQKDLWPKDMLHNEQYDLIPALPHAIQDSFKFLNFNCIVLGKIITGKMSLHVLGGPFMILQSSAAALEQGLVIYFKFLAILSVMLAFTNLLPIPGLDGGHLFFYLFEAIKRKPISIKWQMLFYRLGLIALVLLFVQAMMNDLMRLFS